MPVFKFEALNAQGQEIRDEIDAPSKEEAVSRIRGKGYFPTRVHEKVDKKKVSAKKGGGPKRRKAAGTGVGWVSTKALCTFTRQLSTLQDAGLPILRSVRILEQQQKPGMLKSCLRQITEDVEGGATLSEAMARHPKAFDRLYSNMVAAGEAGGVLDVILQRLADFLEKAQKLKRKIVGALIYPCVVISIAGGIVTFIMVTVVPKFREIFQDFGTKLPGVTEFLISISNWFANGTPPGWMVLVLSPVLIFAAVKMIRQSEIGKHILDVVALKIPVFGQLISKSTVAKFTRTLGTLVAAGVPILEAVTITKATAGNDVYARMLGKVHDAIREGDSFANPLRQSKTVDPIVVNMVDVGEETGELDKMLMKVADNYDDEVDTLVASLVSLLEPIMVVLLGGIVGFIVVALFLPLVTLIQSVMSSGTG